MFSNEPNRIQFEFRRITSNAKNCLEFLLLVNYSSSTMSSNKEISISLITGNVSQKYFSDGEMNKQKQKAAVEGGIANSSRN